MLAFSTAKINGHYDFFTGLITLDIYEEPDLDLIKLALSETPPPIISEKANKLREIRALIKHEVTHFLDHVTTSWGLQYLARRNLLIKSINDKGSDIFQRAEVYYVNFSELQMHGELLDIHVEDISLNQCNITQHTLRYEKKYGAYIIIFFYKGDTLICEVPLSMLSLIEANAISNEFLCRFDDLAAMPQEMRNTAEAVIERKLQKILDEPTLSEYSVVILLAKRHFEFFDSRQLLEYVTSLASFCLNMTRLSNGAIVELIRHSFINNKFGNSIWADLCREMSRHVVAFKTILFMYQWINEAPESQRKSHIELMRNNPYLAIETFWAERGRKKILTDEMEKELVIESVRLSQCEDDISFISQVIDKNQSWKHRRNLRASSFNEIGCIDVLLGDDSVVQFSQRIDFDALGHSYGIGEAYVAADKIIEKLSEKIHMPPGEAATFIEDILSMKDASKL